MNSKTFLALVAIACIIAVVSAQSSADPIASLQSKASSVAATASNTSPISPTETAGTNAGISLNSGLSMQLLVFVCVFVASFLW